MHGELQVSFSAQLAVDVRIRVIKHRKNARPGISDMLWPPHDAQLLVKAKAAVSFRKSLFITGVVHIGHMLNTQNDEILP